MDASHLASQLWLDVVETLDCSSARSAILKARREFEDANPTSLAVVDQFTLEGVLAEMALTSSGRERIIGFAANLSLERAARSRSVVFRVFGGRQLWRVPAGFVGRSELMPGGIVLALTNWAIGRFDGTFAPTSDFRMVAKEGLQLLTTPKEASEWLEKSSGSMQSKKIASVGLKGVPLDETDVSAQPRSATAWAKKNQRAAEQQLALRSTPITLKATGDELAKIWHAKGWAERSPNTFRQAIAEKR